MKMSYLTTFSTTNTTLNTHNHLQTMFQLKNITIYSNFKKEKEKPKTAITLFSSFGQLFIIDYYLLFLLLQYTLRILSLQISSFIFNSIFSFFLFIIIFCLVVCSFHYIVIITII